MRLNITCLILAFVCLLGCQTTENKVVITENYRALLLDNEFPEYQNTKIESQDDIFSLNDEMRSMIAKEILPVRDMRKRATKLVAQIFDKKDMPLSYASDANLTAQQAYQQSIANCLSLTIMVYSLANEADLKVRFQEVYIPEYWVRQGNYNMLTSHINLLITPVKKSLKTVIYENENLILEFDPYVMKKTFTSSIVTKSKVLAMFYNNKAAQALVTADYAKAYAYFRASIEVGPNFSSAWGT